jgi:non-ribosomal peptide synthetase component F
VLLFDDDGKRVGEHRASEIVVRSRYLSPGYWHRPDLMRAAFLVGPQRRLYRAGD